MSAERELMERIEQLDSANGKLAGKMGAICGYLDAVGIPKVPKAHKRVKLMTIMYRQLQNENQRLMFMLNEMDEDDQ